MNLIDEAKGVVAIVEHYPSALQDKQARKEASTEGKQSGDESAREAEVISNILQGICIASPVTPRLAWACATTSSLLVSLLTSFLRLQEGKLVSFHRWTASAG